MAEVIRFEGHSSGTAESENLSELTDSSLSYEGGKGDQSEDEEEREEDQYSGTSSEEEDEDEGKTTEISPFGGRKLRRTNPSTMRGSVNEEDQENGELEFQRLAKLRAQSFSARSGTSTKGEDSAALSSSPLLRRSSFARWV